MMPPRRDVEGRRGAAFDENRHDDRDVGQMGAAVIRRVERVDIARLHAAPVDRPPVRTGTAALQDSADTVPHAAQMDRHMRRIGDQIAGGIEQRAGKIEPFANVDGGGAMLKRGAHFLGDRHEKPAHHLEPYRVDAAASARLWRGAGLVPAEDEIADGVHARAPARLHDGGRYRVDDKRGTVNVAVAIEAGAIMHGRGTAAAIDLRQRGRSRIGEEDNIVHRRPGGRDRLDPRHVDQDRATPVEAEARAVLRQEVRAHRRQISKRHVEQAVGTVIAKPQQDFGPVRLRQIGARVRLHGGECGLQLGHGVRRERQGERAFPHRPPVGQTHAKGRQDTAKRMDHHSVHAEGVGDQTGMLPARATKTGQGIARHVMAARDGNALDGVRHIGDGNGDEALRRLARGHHAARFLLHLRAEGGETLRHDVAIQWLVPVRAEKAGEETGLDLAQHDVAIGDGKRPAAPVAGRSRHRARAFRPDAKATIDKGANGATARRDRVDPHHRRAQANAGHPRFIVPFIAAGIMGDIGRCAPHIKADHVTETRLFRGARQTDDATRRPGQDGVLPPEQ